MIWILDVELPPRHGKSELTSIQFPTWELAKKPDYKFMLASYSMDLSVLNSRGIRENFHQSAFQTVAPNVRLKDDKQRESEWETNKRGGVKAVGLTSGTTGRGADYFITDDMLKDAEEAQSATHKQKIWDWYITVARTRLQPGGAQIHIGTRWAKDDLIGRILEYSKTSKYAKPVHRLRLPAIAEQHDPLGRNEGEALWPEWYPLEELWELRGLSPVWFEALYQQNPQAEEMIHFDVRKILLKDVQHEKMGRYWDFAVTDKESSDYMVGSLISGELAKMSDKVKQMVEESGMPKPFLIHVHDVVRQRATFPTQRKLVIETARKDGYSVPIILEKTRMELAAFQILKADLEEMGFDVRGIVPKGDKVARKSHLETICSMGGMSFSQGDWNQEAYRELDAFPGGDHDDIVDTFEMGLKDLSKTWDTWEFM
jgi:predicted phage terminase large subunit-like protein